MYQNYRSHLTWLVAFLSLVAVAYWLINSIDVKTDGSELALAPDVSSSVAVPAAVKPKTENVRVEGNTSFELNP